MGMYVTLLQELTVQEFQSYSAINVLPPVLPVCGDWYLPVGPLTSQMDADAGHNGRGVLQTERG